MIRIKEGVDLRLLTPQILLAVVAAEDLFKRRNLAAVVTSGRDSKHGKGSLHYLGLAIDLRTRHTDDSIADAIVGELAECLGKQYDVVLEDDHIHVEFDPD